MVHKFNPDFAGNETPEAIWRNDSKSKILDSLSAPKILGVCIEDDFKSLGFLLWITKNMGNFILQKQVCDWFFEDCILNQIKVHDDTNSLSRRGHAPPTHLIPSLPGNYHSASEKQTFFVKQGQVSFGIMKTLALYSPQVELYRWWAKCKNRALPSRG